MAAMTRSRLSRTLDSGSPTVFQLARPWAMSTSTSTKYPSIPKRPALKTFDNMKVYGSKEHASGFERRIVKKGFPIRRGSIDFRTIQTTLRLELLLSYSGLLLYTKGVIKKDAEGHKFYLLISS